MPGRPNTISTPRESRGISEASETATLVVKLQIVQAAVVISEIRTASWWLRSWLVEIVEDEQMRMK